VENLISVLDGLTILHPILPPVAKFGVVVLICLIAFIPVSLLAWIISKAFTPGLSALGESLNKFATYFFDLSKEINNRINEKLDAFYTAYNTVVNFDDPIYKLDGHPVQEAINNFELDLKTAPALAADRESAKAGMIEELNTTLGGLGSGIQSLDNMDIPELELKPEVALKKKKARSTLFIFIPILLAVIIVNSFLLNTFFDEFFGGGEILGVPYALVIAAMFSLIEVGIGFVFGYQEREALADGVSSGGRIIHYFGWIVIFSLALIEFFLYIMLGTNMFGISQSDLIEMFRDGSYFGIILQGGWLSLFGTAIVLSLYIMGHKVSVAYYDFSSQSDLERFKNDLDNRSNMFEKMRDGLDQASSKVNDIIKQIREENIILNQAESSSSSQLERFKDALHANLGNINEAIEKAENIEIPSPEIECQILSRPDTEAHHKYNLVYLLVLISTIVIMTFALPINLDILGLKASFYGSSLVLAFILLGLSCLSGNLLLSKVNVFHTNDEKLARVVQDKYSVFNLIFVIAIMAICIFLLWKVFSSSNILENTVPFTLCIICLIGAFVIGRKIIQAINSWFMYAYIVWLKIRSFVAASCGVVMLVLSKLISALVPVFEGLAFPVRFIFRRV
jgi:hypothetical protein